MDKLNYEIYIPTQPSDLFQKGYGIINPLNNNVYENNYKDFWITVSIFKQSQDFEYADITKDDTIQKIERQEINPFFLEYGFFDGVLKNKINWGNELSIIQKNFIRSLREETLNMNDLEIETWFDLEGKNELPWNTSIGEITIYDIESQENNINSINSKSEILNIKINR